MKMRYGKKDVIAKQYHEGKTIHYIIFSNDKGERLYGIECTKKSFLFWARASDEKSNLYQSPIRKDDKRTRGGKTDQWKGPNPRNEQVDIYDIILSHLLDEGYAETPEAAEAIMVNMSEDWRNSILG